MDITGNFSLLSDRERHTLKYIGSIFRCISLVTFGNCLLDLTTHTRLSPICGCLPRLASCKNSSTTKTGPQDIAKSAIKHQKKKKYQINLLDFQTNSTLYQNAVFRLVDERGIFFYQFFVFQLFHHCRDICLKISRYYRKISRSRRNPFFK